VKLRYSCTVQALRHCTDRSAHRRSRVVSLLFLHHGIRRGRAVSVTPRPLLTTGKEHYRFCRGLGGAQGWSGQVRLFSPPPGFEPRTVQLVASRYANCAIPAHARHKVLNKKGNIFIQLHLLGFMSCSSDKFNDVTLSETVTNQLMFG